MTKRMVIMLILVGVLFGGIFGFQAFKAHMIKKFMAAQGLPPQTVSTIQATRESWQPQTRGRRLPEGGTRGGPRPGGKRHRGRDPFSLGG